jgi:hypothetical protein
LRGGGSLNWNPPKRPLLNPLVGFYGWSALDPKMFMPPWYPLVVVWSKPTNKLWYQTLQYPTYMKDTYLNAHIRVKKKTIKANGEIVEVNIINLFGFTLWDNISKWGEIFL